jgi:hypothetical protein
MNQATAFPASAADAPRSPTPRTVFWLIKATPAWLALPAPARPAASNSCSRCCSLFLRAIPRIALRYFDTEAYSAWCSDVMMWRVADLDDYDGMVEALRDTPFWDTYFQVLHILPGVEDGYMRNYADEAAPAVASSLAHPVV